MTNPQTENDKKLEQRVVKRFHKAISTFKLIEDNDKVLVGLSGGKDSLCLLELLAMRMKVQRPLFKVEAIHIRMENVHYETSMDYLRDFTTRLGVPLHTVSTRFDRIAGDKKPTCFLCSWYRRKQMFNKAQERGCNKIALGHHMDDIVQTALMNVFFQGHFATMPAKLGMRKMPLTIIRPLCMETEDDLRRFAELRKYEKQLKSCPFENASSRADIKKMLQCAEAMNPNAKHSIWNALEAEGKLVQ